MLQVISSAAAHDDDCSSHSISNASSSRSSSRDNAAASKCSMHNGGTSNSCAELTRWQLAQLLTALLQQARATKAATAALRLKRHAAVETALAIDMAHRWEGRRHSTNNAGSGSSSSDTAGTCKSNSSSGVSSTAEQQVKRDLVITPVLCGKATVCVVHR
jgi:hypothetical protein